MATDIEISSHYTSGDLLARLRAALADDGVDPEQPSIRALAPYDQFHGRGLEATEELAGMLAVSATDHILDVGSGIGGPARYFADRFGCRVTGIDLTAEFVAVARHLTGQLGLDDRVGFVDGDALAMPFADARFDGAYSINVAMNIADKAAFYREIHRLLRPGAWLVLSEVAQGPNGRVDYPTPWAARRPRAFSQPRRRPASVSRPAVFRSSSFAKPPRRSWRSAPNRALWSSRAGSHRTARSN